MNTIKLTNAEVRTLNSLLTDLLVDGHAIDRNIESIYKKLHKNIVLKIDCLEKLYLARAISKKEYNEHKAKIKLNLKTKE